MRSLSTVKLLGSCLVPDKADPCLVYTEMVKLRSRRGFTVVFSIMDLQKNPKNPTSVKLLSGEQHLILECGGNPG